MIQLHRLEEQAGETLCSTHADYFSGGAGREAALTDNVTAFENLRLWPRVLRGPFADTLATELAGTTVPHPVLVAPTAFHRLAHPDGELATARASAQTNSLMITGVASTTSVDDVVKAANEVDPVAPIWFQIYLQPDRQFTVHQVRRAEQAGCRALVVTVDSPVFGRHRRDVANNFTTLPDGLNCPNMADGAGRIRDIAFDPSLAWSDLEWLRGQTELPIVVKGVLHPDDVRLAIEVGAAAVIVSNHGGRQLDVAPATIAVLPHLVEAADTNIPLILDGGVRSGSDVLIALAMGASAVAIGRPIVWGLAAAGEDGVKQVLDQFITELHDSLALTGCRTRSDITADLVFGSPSGSGWTR